MTEQHPSNHIPEARKMLPGDELHLTLLMAPFSLNFFTGQDRQHLLAFGRAAFEAGRAAAQQAVQAVVPDGWRLVPVDPTEQMGQAAADYLGVCMKARGLWKAMVEAAPAHPAEGVPAQEVQAAIDRFDAYFRSANGVPPNARVSVPTAEWQELRAMLSTHPTQQGMDAGKLLAEKHTGMKVDYRGLLGQVRRAIKHTSGGHEEMLRQLEGHITELGQRWYAGDTAVVDELLQLYCVEREARAALADQAKQGEQTNG